MKRWILSASLACVCSWAPLSAVDVSVTAPDGRQKKLEICEGYTEEDLIVLVATAFDVEPDTVTLLGFDEEAADASDGKDIYRFIFVKSHGADGGVERSYEHGASEDDAEDIRFIVTTLANKHEVELWLREGELSKAGDRIEHVHPLRFLEVVFTDEEMKIAVSNIRNKGLVWRHFISGIVDSFTVEHAKNNVTEEYFMDFVDLVDVDASKLRPHFDSQNWTQFVVTLIEIVPVGGGDNPFDL